MVFAVVARSPATNSTRPMPSVSSRHADGGGGEVRRLTPSGEIRTRRSASSDATADAAGTATSMARYPQAVGVTVAGKYRVPVSSAPASAGRTARNTPMPRIAPASALTTESTEAITLMSRGVAPTSRSAAKRSSRRAAASRVAVPIRISTGNSTASTPTPNAYRKNGVNTCGPGAAPDRRDQLGAGHRGQRGRPVAHVDGQLVRAGQRGLAEGSGARAGEPVAQLAGRDGAQQRGQRGGDVVLPGAGQPRDPGRDRGARAQRGHVEPLDGPALEVVHAVVPQLAPACPRLRRQGAQRLRYRGALRALPAGQAGVGLEGVEFGEHAEQHGHAERDRDRGEQQPGERLPSAVQREPQAEPDHQRKPPCVPLGSSVATRPSRTTTWRSA